MAYIITVNNNYGCCHIQDDTKTESIEKIESEMKEAAKKLDFERAMELRDVLFELKAKLEE